jgi:hypothetical protein
MQTTADGGSVRKLRWGDLRLATKVAVAAFLVLLLVGPLELAARFYWHHVKGIRGTSAEAIWRTFYPEVADSGIDRLVPGRGNEFKVLLLGGSVLHPSFGSIAARLGTALEAKLGRSVRVVNLAYPGMTSRDSRIKYEHFADHRFDLVLVYDGINDVHLNNTPPGGFRPDYSHAARYAQQYALRRHPEVRWFTLPYTADYLARQLGNRWMLTSEPRREWQKHGDDVRTPPSFEANLDAIAAEGARRGDPVVLMTFAYHLPANYTAEAFAARKLDYDGHVSPATMWGQPHNLPPTLDLQNEAVRRVAARHGLPLIDQRSALPGGKRYFHDPCHLTDAGCARWVENVVNGLDLSGRGSRAAAHAGGN